MNKIKAVFKFIVAAIGGGFVALLVIGIYIHYFNGGHASWITPVLLLGTALCCGYGWAADDIQAVRRENASKREVKIAEAKARAEEQERKESAERYRIEQERIQAIKSDTANKIYKNQGYELNIMPFLKFLSHFSPGDGEMQNLINKCENNAQLLSKKAEELNAIAAKNSMDLRLQVHSR